MRLGLDFDNTIACYHTAFHSLAVARSLIPPLPILSKSQVRDLLRSQGREDAWTELQGYVYGPGMAQVDTFPGVAQCLRTLLDAGVEVCIISHKTRTPYRGPAWDLHQAAQSWLERQGFFDLAQIGLSPDRVYFELTLAEKLQRIAQQQCTHFLDDLPEVLAESTFPEGVHRLLFDPEDAYPGEPHDRIRSWPELATWILNQRGAVGQVANLPSAPRQVGNLPHGRNETVDPRRDDVRRLLDQAGLTDEFTLQPLPGGGNNRVWRVDVGSASALLKVYFRHPQDPRDRLQAEFGFTSFAWQQGIRRVPQPLACDRSAGMGLYEFIDGVRLEPHEVNEAAVSQALTFYRELNQHRQSAEAQRLPVGSEACFCLTDHLHCVDRRLKRCDSWLPVTEVDHEALAFIQQEVRPRWQQLRDSVATGAGKIGLGPDDMLPLQARRLSPSDFGFHNALMEKTGRLRFVDFEYAGWDDPAKLAGDFFCQPALPVPSRFWTPFVEELVADLPDPVLQRRRLELLLPVYRMKWVTILLNDFQPADNDRRRFARPGQDVEQRKAEQLVKARELRLHV